MTIALPDTATVLDLEIHQGETWDIEFPVIDRNGTAYPVAGAIVKAVVRPALDDPSQAPYYTWDSQAAPPNAIAVGTGVRLLTSAAQSAAFMWRSGVYDVLVNVGGEVAYIAKGRLTVVPRSTN